MVGPEYSIVFKAHALSREIELRDVSSDRSIGNREKGQVRSDSRRNRNGLGLTAIRIGADDTVPRVGRESKRIVSQAFDFAKLLVIAEDESPVLYDGTARRAAELIAAKWRLLCVEEIPRIQTVVPQKFETTSPNLIHSRLA